MNMTWEDVVSNMYSPLHAAVQKQFHWVADVMGFLPTLFFDEGRAWGRSRRIIAPSLHGHNVRDMIPTISEVSIYFVHYHFVG